SLCSHRLAQDMCLVCGVFFFQAEDGIRDRNVTGVQTCALPILMTGSDEPGSIAPGGRCSYIIGSDSESLPGGCRRRTWRRSGVRSEERRVGKEGGERGVGVRVGDVWEDEGRGMGDDMTEAEAGR